MITSISDFTCNNTSATSVLSFTPYVCFQNQLLRLRLLDVPQAQHALGFDGGFIHGAERVDENQASRKMLYGKKQENETVTMAIIVILQLGGYEETMTRWTERQADRQTDRQARPVASQPARQTDRQTNRQTDRDIF